MLFDEYIRIFEEILKLTEEIEVLCLQAKSNETEELFHKRNALMQKLEVPEDIDNEKFAKIVSIKDKISEKNASIAAAMQKEKEMIKTTMDEIKRQHLSSQSFQQSTENQIKSSYKEPPFDGNSGSIFGKQ